MGTLYIVGTPIGNLEDITKRGLRILSEVDLILCEDTRIVKRLLDHYNIRTSVLSYHQHSKLSKTEYIIQLIKEGENLALVSDAGTPGISDPGNKLVELVIRELGDRANIIPIPGASALVAAASVSGFPMDKFIFLGFPPVKNKRKKFFGKVASSKHPVILYESPHRIVKTLYELGKSPVVVCRELTKKFETIYRGKADRVLENLKKEEIRGEFTVIVGRE